MNNNAKPKILIAFKEDGENGGPYISHDRIMNNDFLKSRFEFEKLWVPRSRKFINPFFFLKYVRKIKEINPSLVHVAGLQLEGFFLILVCRFAKVKTVLAVHGSVSEAQDIKGVRLKLFKKLEKYCVSNATCTYGVSDYVSRWDICRFAKRYYGTIYNFPGEFSVTKKTTSIRNELHISTDDVVVVSTGRITREKGYDTLSIVAQHFALCTNVKFLIVGDGNYRERFERDVFNANIQKNVFFLGYRSNVYSILCESDIFVICTKHETLCISALEAAMASLPLVVSNVGGLPEIVDESCGFLVDPYDAEAFTSALSYLIKSREKRELFGKNAHDKICSKFSSCEIEKKLDELYSSLISN